MSVLVFGNAARDLSLRVARIPGPGGSALALDRHEHLGGKGVNQAVAAARAGAFTALVAAVGGDATGCAVRRLLEEEGIAAHLAIRPDASDEAVIWVDQKGRQAIVVHQPPAGPELATVLEEAAAQLGADDRLLIAGFLGRERLAAIAARAAARGVRIQLNLAPFPCDYGRLWESVELVVANREELDVHLGTVDPQVAALRLFARGVRVLVATAGPEGAWWIEPERHLHVPAPAVAAVDTTAAGDVLAGVLAAELERGVEPEAALRLAVHAASLAVTRAGAVPSIPTAAEIAELRRALARADP